jgi:hypothetical protein
MMTERVLSPLALSFRREALDILAGRNTASIKVPARNGRVVLQPLAKGYRIDVVGLDQAGKPQRLATAHYSELRRARTIGRMLGQTMRVRFDDKTLKGVKP